jgi:hypothetical protein
MSTSETPTVRKFDSSFHYMGCVNGFPGEYQDGNGNVVPRDQAKVWATKYPDRIVNCKAQGHKLEGISTNRGYHQTWCPTCKIWWDMDSGD